MNTVKHACFARHKFEQQQYSMAFEFVEQYLWNLFIGSDFYQFVFWMKKKKKNLRNQNVIFEVKAQLIKHKKKKGRPRTVWRQSSYPHYCSPIAFCLLKSRMCLLKWRAQISMPCWMVSGFPNSIDRPPQVVYVVYLRNNYNGLCDLAKGTRGIDCLWRGISKFLIFVLLLLLLFFFAFCS